MIKAAVITVVLFLSTSLAQAAPIVGVTGTSNTGDFSGFSTLQETLDFSNISGSQLTDVTTNGFGWFSDGSAPGPTGYPVINTYSLNALYQIGALGFWNAATPTNPMGPLGNNAFGFQDVIIESSVDGTNFSPLVGAAFTLAGLHTFSIAPDTSGNSAEILNFNPVSATFVRFTVLTDYNNAGFPGYQALVFDGLFLANVPELSPNGAGLAFAVLGLLSLAATRGKRLRSI